jgi:hypothetical protein
MSVRLLLLRLAKRRSEEERDTLNILVKSYRGYSKDNRRRSGEELACVVAGQGLDVPSLSSSSSAIVQSHQAQLLFLAW